MANPTYLYFSEQPVTLVLETTTGFNGAQHTNTAAPSVKPGNMALPAETVGGLFNFHQFGVKVQDVLYNGTGSVTVKRCFLDFGGATIETTITTALSQTAPLTTAIFLGPSESLKFISSGAGKLAITSQLARDRVVN